MKYGKHSFRKEVLFQFQTPKEAYQKEVELIAQEKGNPLCYNIHLGGYFDAGDKISIATMGRKRKSLSSSHRLALSIAHKKVVHDAVWNANMRAALKGRDPLSTEARKRQALSLSKSIRGKMNPNFGHRWSLEAKQAASKRTKGRSTPKVICEKCGKMIGIGVLVRHQTGPYSCVRIDKRKRKIVCNICTREVEVTSLRRHQQTKRCFTPASSGFGADRSEEKDHPQET
jgi:hypothetical protein